MNFPEEKKWLLVIEPPGITTFVFADASVILMREDRDGIGRVL